MPLVRHPANAHGELTFIWDRLFRTTKDLETSPFKGTLERKDDFIGISKFHNLQCRKHRY